MSELNELKNMFYLGNYQGTINEGGNIDSEDEQVRIERDVLIYRSYIAQGNTNIVIEEIKEDFPVDLQAVLLLAKYFSGDSKAKAEAFQNLEKGLKGSLSLNPTFLLIAAIIYSNEQKLDDALKCAHQVKNLEGKAMMVQLYLKIDRLKNAEKELAEMQSMDDENTLTLLSTAWIRLYHGTEDKAKEAFYIYSELIDKIRTFSSIVNWSFCLQSFDRKYGRSFYQFKRSAREGC